ncbi:MAG: FecR/PupR family sigma factor regulator [Sphingopyxis sp.]|uniref:FecR/PupR family sigma factor regulator n=1 Tax=Sphingopyxis sp. TaxID=1908224 RepID=UPI002ABBDC85|nr:FecR/PupR family sigma factor regulator [Sphingopyxis sp.]MDZ3833296.1 FecR/PupR family sigma factor regulator [Sphingopyxis sp.]
MTKDNPETNEAARRWIVRIGDENFDDWDDFTQWLEADPAHLAAYEAALDNDAWAAAAVARLRRPPG